MTPTYAVALIGAGNIAAGYDRPSDSPVLTHAHAVARHPRLAMTAIYDADPARAAAAGGKWNMPVAADLDALLAANPDIVVIATPTETHAGLLERLLARPPRIVLCEKPLSHDLAASTDLVARYAAAGVPLAINFQRRFDARVIALQSRYAAGELGPALAGAVWYSKGIRHNGSHAVDLLRFLFGEAVSASVRRRVFDHGQDDPTVSATLEFKSVAIELIAADERNFSLFEIDLLFSQARYRFLQGGMVLQRFEVGADPLFPGYRDLRPAGEGPSGLSTALLARFDNLVACLDGASPLIGSAEDALATQRLCESLAASSPSRCG
jgi:predicted dehydrogenase